MSARLFVGNLSYDVTEAELRELFSTIGPVTQVRIPLDRESGRPRGFAFVDFAERAQAEEAIRKLDQHTLKGRALAINEATAREAGPGPRGPGGPGGGFGGPPRGPGGPGGPGPRGPGGPGYGSQGGGGGPGGGGGGPKTFGADAPPKGARKPEPWAAKGEKGPKGPMRVRSGGPSFAGGEVDDEDGDDEVPFWAAKDADEEE